MKGEKTISRGVERTECVLRGEVVVGPIGPNSPPLHIPPLQIPTPNFTPNSNSNPQARPPSTHTTHTNQRVWSEIPKSPLPRPLLASVLLLLLVLSDYLFLHTKLDMSARLSRSLPLPPRSLSSRMEEVIREGEKPGIVTILRYNPGTARAASLRRTLSADMSSREWLAKNGFHPLKKTVSSVSIEDSSSSDDEEDTIRKDVEGCGGQVYIWKSMKEARKDDAESEKRGETWSSILFQKVEDSKSLPPPYVHPLVKRSKSCLSTKSLEVCTESLGSETGSDGFSSYLASDAEDMEAEDGHEPRATAFDIEEFYMAKCNHAMAARKTRPRSFPPPIQSLSQGNGGGSVSMHSRRDNGRLVLEAVSVPTERNFEARREEGRLVLTFTNNNESYRDDDEDMDEEEDELVMEMEDISMEENEKEETEESDEEGVYKEFALERIPKLPMGGPMNVHKLAKMLNKPITTVNRNPGWQGKYVGAFDYGEDKEEDPIQLEQSLPLTSPVARMLSMPQSVPSTAMAPASSNAYEYFWRNKTPANTFFASIGQPLSTMKGHGLNISVYAKNLPSDEALKNRPLTRSDGYLAPLSQSCNNPSRTNLLWGPKCIATS